MFTELNGELYVTAQDPTVSGYGHEVPNQLYRTDGTVAGTGTLLPASSEDQDVGSGSGAPIAALGNSLVFASNDSSFESGYYMVQSWNPVDPDLRQHQLLRLRQHRYRQPGGGRRRDLLPASGRFQHRRRTLGLKWRQHA